MNRMEVLRVNTPQQTNNALQSDRRENTFIHRIKKEFIQSVLIGDILVNDQEFNHLLDYFKVKCGYIIASGKRLDIDPVFATALVQIGIRYYNGNLWRNIAQLLERESINPSIQRNIGESFYRTLKSYNKVMISNRGEWVNNILLHGFVSNHYAFDLFEFLFKYYNLDLERDLERNTEEMMESLMQIAQRDDNTGRTYLLVKHTANALALDTNGGKKRIRKILRLIDNTFWEQLTTTNPASRISTLFNQWVKQSVDFKSRLGKYHAGMGTNRGRKSFSSPYLYCDYNKTAFKIKLPKQLVRADEPKSIQWRICIGDQKPILLEADSYATVTGFKTEEFEFPISSEGLFRQIDLELFRDGERIRSFKIYSDCIRFFDSFGSFLPSDNNMQKGKVYAFTKHYETPISDALIDNEPVNGLVRSYFELETGDIIRIPDGNIISIGNNMDEGLLQRKRLSGVICSHEGIEVPIFTNSPSILIKINEMRANGTLIHINNKRFRLFDEEVTKIELADRSGDTCYLLNLGKYGCVDDGFYNVYIDVPNDRKKRTWQFVLMQDFSYQFEDAPYIFQKRGTIRFSEQFLLTPMDRYVQKNYDENSYNFEINPEQDIIRFQYKSLNHKYMLHFDVPALQWKFDESPWEVDKPSDIWYTELPQFIYLKYPEKNGISFTVDGVDEENEDGRVLRLDFKLSKENIFECDMTRVNSWLGRKQVLRLGFLELTDRRIEFLRIFTKSIVISNLLKGDFQKNMIYGDLTIVGKSNYFVDIWKMDSNELLAEKIRLNNGNFSIPYHYGSSPIKVDVFEDVEDDSGFGLSNYSFVESFEQRLTNPFDLRGKTLKIRCIKKGIDSIFQMRLSNPHTIRQLERLPDKNRNKYTGKLFVKSSFHSPINVILEFPDLEQIHFAYLQFFDGYDDVEFLYDHQLKNLVKSEQNGLSRAVKYRRYESLYPEDYVYVMDFID